MCNVRIMFVVEKSSESGGGATKCRRVPRELGKCSSSVQLRVLVMVRLLLIRCYGPSEVSDTSCT